MNKRNVFSTFVLVILISFSFRVMAEYTGPELKSPLPGGYSWFINTESGGSCGGTCYDKYHDGNSFYSIDFDDDYAEDTSGDLGSGIVDILAAADGKVIHATSGTCYQCTIGYTASGAPYCLDSGADCYVVIDHGSGDGEGYITVYRHMANGSIAVSEGDSVAQGQMIGKMGTTGQSTGTHLHFQVRYDNNSAEDNTYLEGVTLDSSILFVDYAVDEYYRSTNSGLQRREESYLDYLNPFSGDSSETVLDKLGTRDGDYYLYDTTDSKSARIQDYTGGDSDGIVVIDSNSGLAVDVRDNIYDVWISGSSSGYSVSNTCSKSWFSSGYGPKSKFGIPVTGVYYVNDDGEWRQDFQNGYITQIGSRIYLNCYSNSGPGWTSSGWNGNLSAAVAQAYERNGASELMGSSFDDGGGVYLHEWYDINIQNFRISSANTEYAIITKDDLISDPEANPASVIRSGFWAYYGSGAISTTSGNQYGPEALGAPLGDEMDTTTLDGTLYGYDPVCDEDKDGWNNEEEREACIDTYCEGTESYTSVQRFEKGSLCYASGTTYLFNSDGELTDSYDDEEDSEGVGGAEEDSDGDGLSDEDEEDYGTFNGITDSDHDGLDDGEEVHTYDTDPADDDSDNDGLEDGTEVGIHTDPGDKDTDDDGLSDGYEIEHGYASKLADGDGDGLNDGEEVDAGTNPKKSDTDGDGLDDYVELHTYNTDPADEDTDKDGLTDGEEIESGFDPLEADADSDSLDDSEELAAGTDPNDSDSDGDDSTDGSEVNTYGTNPLDTDTDDDGLNDSYEIAHEYDPLDSDMDDDGLVDGADAEPLVARLDADGDGLENSYEVSIGSDPNDADSDDDGLGDYEEVNTYDTNPASADTDGDGLSDYLETVVYGAEPPSTLIASDGTANDSLGRAVAIDGDVAVVGAYRDSEDGSSSGSVYVFRFDGSKWNQEAKLTASDAAANDQFGFSVSVSGDWILVGSWQDDDLGSESGSAYLYYWDGTSWTEHTKLTASDGALGDYFGTSVAISDDVAVVSSPEDDQVWSGSGSVYVFRFDGSSWDQEAKIYSSDSYYQDAFGQEVSVSGDVIAVGTPNDEGMGANAGSVSIYRYDGSDWNEEQEIYASDGTTNDAFGFSVDVDENSLVVGAYNDSVSGVATGSAYVFTWDGSSWTEESHITASDGADQDKFGAAVSISGEVLVVGSYGDDDDGSSAGSAYIFKLGDFGWEEDEKIEPADATANNRFGRSVGIDGSYVVIGAYQSDVMGSNSGEAYLFKASYTDTLDPNDPDVDDDGLNDGDEFTFGTDPNDTDSDDDGIGDKEEAETATDSDGDGYSNSVDAFPNDLTEWSDSDGDGVGNNSDAFPTNSSESADTDGDGVGDNSDLCPGTLVISSSDIVNAEGCAYSDLDSDSDTLSDYEEIVSYSTDPYNSDSDGDEVSDADEIYLETGPNDSDSDDDGLSDGDELNLGTDPLNTDSDDDGLSDYSDSYPLSTDNDADGFVEDDCDNTNSSIYPGATETCEDEIDQDCDGSDAICDADNDGVSDAEDLCPSTTLLGENDTVNDEGCALSERDTDSDTLTDYAETVGEKTAYLIPDGTYANQSLFGHAVAVNKDWLAVSSIYGTMWNAGSSLGLVTLYHWEGSEWIEWGTFTGSDTEVGDGFGFSLDLDGDVLVVGSLTDDDAISYSGSVYVFRWDGSNWNQEAKLVSDDPQEGAYLGTSLSLSGNTIVAGAYCDFQGGVMTGAAYVFEYDGTSWIQTNKIVPVGAQENDRIGYSVSVNGDALAIGGYNASEEGFEPGAVWIYRFDGTDWEEEQKLMIEEAGYTSFAFGYDVSLDGNRLLAEAGGEESTAYIFDYNSTWKQTAKLSFVETDLEGEKIGGDVALDGDIAVVGTAVSDHTYGARFAAATVYHWNGSEWTRLYKLDGGDHAYTYSNLMYVDVDEGLVLVGAWVENNLIGAAHVYDLSSYTNPKSSDTDGDGIADAVDPLPINPDNDADGYGADDCDNTDPSIHPGVFDICWDEIDQDCDGSDNECDFDGDGQPSLEDHGEDCDDSNDAIYFGADEICGDGIDQDCDGSDSSCTITYTVTKTADTNDGKCTSTDCSLREALVVSKADTTGAQVEIIFSISSSDSGCSSTTGFCTISPTKALPSLTRGKTTIDGGGKIVIDGTSAGSTTKGLIISNSSFNVIKNLGIQNFGSHGISITGSTASENEISGCYIGVDSSGVDQSNGGSGIYASSGADTIISGNAIAYNTLKGVHLNTTATIRNIITKNSLHDNVSTGIVLATSANNNKAKPVMTLAKISGTTVTITGTATSGDTIEVFISSADAEGQTYIGSTTADSTGNWSLTTNTTTAPKDTKVLATATDTTNGTSQFSGTKTVR